MDAPYLFGSRRESERQRLPVWPESRTSPASRVELCSGADHSSRIVLASIPTVCSECEPSYRILTHFHSCRYYCLTGHPPKYFAYKYRSYDCMCVVYCQGLSLEKSVFHSPAQAYTTQQLYMQSASQLKERLLTEQFWLQLSRGCVYK